MQLLNNALFNAKKKKIEHLSYGKLIQKNCNQRKIKIFKVMHKIQARYLMPLSVTTEGNEPLLMDIH